VPDSVHATASNGSLFLTGTVSRNGQRDAAQDAAASGAGVLSISNEIDVLGDT
jgi:osmotically-inducible protein OsmY